MTKPVFTATVTAKGGRDGSVVSSEGNLVQNIAMPGSARKKDLPDATNPEQLFAAGYAACFDGALQFIAKKEKEFFESEVTVSVSLLKDEKDDGFKLGTTIYVKGIRIENEKLEKLVHKAHEFCPYSKAIKGNIDVKLEVVE
ncbi:organic hydroperoxide resistance protein [Anaerobacillus isosaccharinicus]|uniref:Organic hydroperoxide resistance protein n=1 Tax=Anaerobacillus isosaccharinicus TaxID=1532552 RepID=A0A1S2LHC5_9BACI|nr:organic hydroperoxide resistance protein [Anaerobacillus isosaccharinicus]MBA5586603.1 organic hydroperoxide resistance protein [Anaerobacillus isosaccharinicus]QOY35162.1 organic hydroperoxide resistance protein [Anaerobacillus isosaccharinicus]